MDTPKPKRRWLSYVLLTLVAVTVCAVLVHSVRLITVSWFYGVKATYSQVPVDDRQLEEWLKVQEGVVPHTVHVSREGNSLRVVFIQVRNGYGKPAIPDLPKACGSLGYEGLQGKWTDDLDR